MSDEEKSANLKNDDYSSQFETALEQFTETCNTKARSDFVQSQLENWESDSVSEDPPELPATEPPDIKNIASDEKCSNSGFPLTEQIVNSATSDNQLETASVKLEDSQEVVTKEESRTENTETSASVIVVDDSIITISDTSSSKIESNPFEYPDDLNPFSNEDDEEKTPPSAVPTKSDYDSSLNPFGSEDDDETEQPAPSPVPRAKKKIKPQPEDKEISNSPFKDDEDEEPKKQPSPNSNKKIIPAPRITLTPFWNEEQESVSTIDKPVPLPRQLKYVAFVCDFCCCFLC